jgi:hypothetical protein
LVPHIEKEVATRLEDTTRLFVAEDLVGKDITPNWQATASNSWFSNGKASASA